MKGGTAGLALSLLALLCVVPIAFTGSALLLDAKYPAEHHKAQEGLPESFPPLISRSRSFRKLLADDLKGEGEGKKEPGPGVGAGRQDPQAASAQASLPPSSSQSTTGATEGAGLRASHGATNGSETGSPGRGGSSAGNGAGGDETKGVDECRDRYIYVYDLPPKFNQGLLDDCEHLNPFFSKCSHLTNRALGPPMPPHGEGCAPGGADNGLPPLGGSAGFCNGTDEGGENGEGDGRAGSGGCWHETGQFALEVLMHNRVRRYRCLTRDPARADAFYLPYYPGLDAERFIFESTASGAAVEDQLAGELAALLRASPMWQRSQGRDHFYALGRITWDFRKGQHDSHWGVPLLQHPELNMLRVTIEADVRDRREFGVPYPTAFHPSTDRQVAAWMAAVRARAAPRMHRAAFIGGRRGGSMAAAAALRSALMQQCGAAPAECHLVECTASAGSVCAHSGALLETMLSTDFCLQPRGDSVTRKSVFDSLLAGCIPVFFNPETAYLMYTWHLPADPASYSVFVPAAAVVNGSANVVDALRAYSTAQIARMRETILTIIPRIVYSQGGLEGHEDAADTSISSILRHIRRLKDGLETW